MNLVLNVLFLFTISILLLTSCSYSKIEKGESVLKSEKDEFVVWALADIQPVNSSHKKAFQNAVDDVNANIKYVDIAIVAGDIVEKTDASDFEWYIETKKGSYIKNFYEVIGNHDLKPDKGKLFKEKLRKDVQYTLSKGNILFIFLSDEERGKATTITDNTFKWWKEKVITNQDKIIVVTSHAPLDGSGITFSSIEERKIKDSRRFIDILEDYNIDLWLSGHLHLPHAFNNTLTTQDTLNGADFVHISSIRPELLGLKRSESRFIYFKCGTDKVSIRSRDHELQKWQDDLEQEITLSRKILCK